MFSKPGFKTLTTLSVLALGTVMIAPATVRSDDNNKDKTPVTARSAFTQLRTLEGTWKNKVNEAKEHEHPGYGNVIYHLTGAGSALVLGDIYPRSILAVRSYLTDASTRASHRRRHSAGGTSPAALPSADQEHAGTGGSMDAVIGKDRFCELFKGRAVVVRGSGNLPAGAEQGPRADLASGFAGRAGPSLCTRAGVQSAVRPAGCLCPAGTPAREAEAARQGGAANRRCAGDPGLHHGVAGEAGVLRHRHVHVPGHRISPGTRRTGQSP